MTKMMEIQVTRVKMVRNKFITSRRPGVSLRAYNVVGDVEVACSTAKTKLCNYTCTVGG